MKILLINVRLDSGSVGRIVRDLYKGIKKAGHECKIAYARGGIADIPECDTVKICSNTEVIKHAALTRAFGNTAFYSHGSTLKFLRWVSEYEPDIIHIHSIYGYYLNMKDLFEYVKSNNIKFISTLHCCWDFTGHCCYFDYAKCDKWKTVCVDCVQKAAYPKSSFFDNTKLNHERKKELYSSLGKCVIVTPSKWLEKLVNESFLKQHQVITIENGIDINVFKRLEKVNPGYGLDMSKPIILCIASIWERRKGWEDVVEFSKFIEKNNIDVQLVVVGVNEKQKSKLDSNTIAILKTNNVKELAQIYNAATVLFNPTYEDNYPTVNVEAIACGTPIITYNTGGSPEAVLKYRMGEIIDHKDYKKVVEYAKNNFGKDKIPFDYRYELSFARMTEDYMKVYESI